MIAVATSTSREGAAPPSPPPALQFLDLPSEIHSQIAAYLPLTQIIPFLSLHPTLLGLSRSNLTPLPQLIREALDGGWPYHPLLAKLPSLSLFLPDDGGAIFLEVLVRARPKWVLERLELGRWTEGVWKEAFERRFLPSWKRYKGEGDTWRAVFLRILGRLEHRNLGCTHDESWTRFITLHRNGSASINRIYSRQFDPYQIYDELKHQNNFAAEPTTVRVVVHLQDVRVIVLGVLYKYPSLFVNQNAHDLLHPPLLTEVEMERGSSNFSGVGSSGRAGSGESPSQRPAVDRIASGTASANPSSATNEVYYPLVRSLSPSGPQDTSYGLTDGTFTSSSSTAASQPPPTTRRATLSSLLSPSLRSRLPSSQNVNGSGSGSGMPAYPAPESPSWAPSNGKRGLGARLTSSRSRDSDDTTPKSTGKKWGLGRRHSGEDRGTVIPASALFSGGGSGSGGSGGSSGNAVGTNGHEAEGARVIPASALFGEQGRQGSVPDSSRAPGPSILANSTTATHTASAVSIAVSSSSSPYAEVSQPTGAGPDTREPQAQPQTGNDLIAPRPRLHLPYPPMRRPQPAPSYRFYPNYTPPPFPHPSSDSTYKDGVSAGASAVLFDRRQAHQVVEDDYAGNIWAYRRTAGDGLGGVGDGDTAGSAEGGDEVWGGGERYVEWDEAEGGRRRWVGPMLVIAQLHPTHHPRAQPPGVDPSLPTEGSDPDLGPKGMYASLGFEDLEKIMGWVELKGGGAYVADPRRGGMGFE